MVEAQRPKKKILLIDDEVSLLKFTKRNLEMTGDYEVTTAGSGTEGLEKAQAEAFDLVITDYKMPGLDGKSVIKALKSMNPDAPVVLFSIYYDDEKLDPEVRHAADGLISKPIDRVQLYQVVKDALAKSKP